MRIAFLLLLAACRIETVEPTPDAADFTSRCQTPPGGFGSVSAPVLYAVSHSAGYSVLANLQGGARNDEIGIHLLHGTGVFANGMPTSFPVTYNLIGDESEFATCGACVVLFPDVVGLRPTGNPYVARGGTLTIQQLEPTLIIRLANLALERVSTNIDPSPLLDPSLKRATSSKADESGCSTTVTSVDLVGAVSEI